MTYTKNDPKSIASMFDSIAPSYDFANALLSFNCFRLWNRQLIKHGLKKHAPNTFLDLCSGTGDIAFTYLKPPFPQTTYLLDFSEKMLEIAEKKGRIFKEQGCSLVYIKGDAAAIALPDGAVEAITCAYGIRNVKSAPLVFQEAFRVLQKGGHFTLLELTRPKNPFISPFYSLYLRFAIPVLGRLVTSNKEAYCYLKNSINTFTDPAVLEEQLKEVGFCHTFKKPLFGGIATLVGGEK